MSKERKWSSLNVREERMKKDCKCQKEHPNNTCKCGKGKGETSFMNHFNDISRRR
jgi:hypothetical protein